MNTYEARLVDSFTHRTQYITVEAHTLSDAKMLVNAQVGGSSFRVVFVQPK